MNDFIMKLIEYGVEMRLHPSETKNMIRVGFYKTGKNELKFRHEFWMGVGDNDMVSNKNVLNALNEELISFLQLLNIQRGN